MKRLGFVIEGLSNLKVFGSLLREAPSYGVEPVALISAAGGGKEYDIVRPEILCQLFPAVKPENITTYQGGGAVVTNIPVLAAQLKLNGVILINAYKKYVTEVGQLKKLGIASYGLDYFVNALYTVATEELQAEALQCVSNLTKRLITSEYWRDLEFAVSPTLKEQAAKYIPVGNLVLDTFKYCQTTEIPEPFKVLQDKKYVVLMTPNIRKKHTYIMYGWRTTARLKHAIATWQKVCHQLGYTLVIKSRAKQWDTPIYRTYADYFFDDVPEAIYPYTSAWLIAGSQLLGHFGSLSVLEAAGCGVPSIAISAPAVDKLHDYMKPAARELLRETMLTGQPRSLFNWPSVAQSLDITATAEQLTTAFEALGVGKSERASYAEFNHKFNGQTDYDAARRVYQHII